jgi:hypothetical protein
VWHRRAEAVRPVAPQTVQAREFEGSIVCHATRHMGARLDLATLCWQCSWSNGTYHVSVRPNFMSTVSAFLLAETEYTVHFVL